MSNQFTFSIKESLAKLQKDLESLAPSIEKEIGNAIKDASYAAYASIVSQAQNKLNSTRQEYLKGLSITDIGDNSYLIELDGDVANKLEDGYSGFDMTPGMLASQKMVEVGSRAGHPWVQKSVPQGKMKETHKYAHVPLQRQPHSKAPGAADMAQAVREMSAVNGKGRTQKLTSVFKDADGNAIEGKVAIGKSDNSKYDGLVKYQKIYQNANGKNTVQSIYINYRTVSEKGKPWMHPGYAGIKAFQEAEKELEKNLDAIVKSLLGG